MRIAPDGIPSIVALALICAGAWFALKSPAATIVLALPLLMSLWFYRDPERYPNGGEHDWTSPADGKVIELIEDAVDEYAGETTKIGIFMNGFDVHVNRFPTDGTIENIKYVPGKKWFAIEPKASENNERLYVGISTRYGRATLVQIAGILARRIAMHKRCGDALARGERYGMIKLGSKVDVYLPKSVRPTVRVGDVVRAGETVIATADTDKEH